MAKNLNKVTLRGRLGKDLELKSTSSGKKYVRFSLANNQDYGEVERCFWLDCIAWDPIASLMERMVGKGCDIIVDGILTKSEWEKDGNKVSKMEVLVRNVEFITFKKDSEPTKAQSKGNTFTPQVEDDYEEYEEYDPTEEF